MEELGKLDVPPALLTWISSFLSNRQQAVRIGGILSDWKALKGGVLQEIKLGVILFTVMTALEITPRNSISRLNTVVSDVYYFAVAHNMKLNPIKCKEMFISLLHNSNSVLKPIIVGDNVTEGVTSYRLVKNCIP